MAKVTSKYQVTVPKKIADEYHIRPGDNIDWSPAGETIRVSLPENGPFPKIANRGCIGSIRPRRATRSAEPREQTSRIRTVVGHERISTDVAALVDTNVLVYQFDNRFPATYRRLSALTASGDRRIRRGGNGAQFAATPSSSNPMLCGKRKNS